MDDDTTRDLASTGDRSQASDTVAPLVEDLPDGRPAQVRPQDPAAPVHVIDPGDVGGIGQHDVSTPSEAPVNGQAGARDRSPQDA